MWPLHYCVNLVSVSLCTGQNRLEEVSLPMVILEVERTRGKVKSACWEALILYQPLAGFFRPELSTPTVLVPERLLYVHLRCYE